MLPVPIHMVVFLLLLGILLPPARAQPSAQGNTATLSVVGGQVEVQAPGAGAFNSARDGQTVTIGTRVRTGGDGRAVLTFFDGTTATLDPNTELTLESIQPGGGQGGGLLVGVGLAVGRVWSQVSSLFDRGSNVEVRAAGTTAVAHEGARVGFRVDPDGTVICWTIAGRPLTLVTADGEIEVLAGQQVELGPGASLGLVSPRTFGPGLLEVRTEGAALAWLVNPNDLTVGFPRADLPVNQVLDATTSLPSGSSRWIRLPGPTPGLYRLVLHSPEGGAYRVRVVLGLSGRELFAREWTGDAAAGERLIAELTVDAAEGRPTGARLDDPRPLAGQPPGKFVSP